MISDKTIPTSLKHSNPSKTYTCSAESYFNLTKFKLSNEHSQFFDLWLKVSISGHCREVEMSTILFNSLIVFQLLLISINMVVKSQIMERAFFKQKVPLTFVSGVMVLKMQMHFVFVSLTNAIQSIFWTDGSRMVIAVRQLSKERFWILYQFGLFCSKITESNNAHCELTRKIVLISAVRYPYPLIRFLDLD